MNISNNQTYNQFLAEHYDSFYTYKKNYKKEALTVLEIFKTYNLTFTDKIIDVGCGTGEHALHIAQEGYVTTGIDISEPMIKKAVEKSKGQKNLSFACQDVTNIPKKYSFAYSLFHVINCLETEFQLQSFINSVVSLLPKNGIYIFDCWNTEAIIANPPQSIKDSITINTETVQRTVHPELLPDSLSYLLTYSYAFKQKNETVVHKIKLFKKSTIEKIVQESGCHIVAVMGPIELHTVLTDTDRTTTYVIQKN